jgi:hypothetical protein
MSEFPTGKPHVSFSEVATWHGCGYKHKLSYIDKIVLESDWIHADFGKHVHVGIENYMKTRVMDIPVVTQLIELDWERSRRSDVEKWKSWAANILGDFPAWLDAEYPGWELLGAELPLYEDIPHEDVIKFKGFVDSLIRVPLNEEKTKWKIWILDWKTGPAYGWRREKLEDKLVLAQLWLYKSYILRKLNLESRDVGCAFVVLKKGAKPGSTIAKYEITVGPKPMEHGEKMVTDMVGGVRRGKFLKNKYNCDWCDFAKSGHCKR